MTFKYENVLNPSKYEPLRPFNQSLFDKQHLRHCTSQIIHRTKTLNIETVFAPKIHHFD